MRISDWSSDVCSSDLPDRRHPRGRTGCSPRPRRPIYCEPDQRHGRCRQRRRPMSSKLRVNLNSDLGESFGAWTMGDDAAMLAVVTTANVACGFHAGDWTVMQQTVDEAVKDRKSTRLN